ncbi:MAG: response regulator [Lachnospiraceae bacterium]|nr:response regulator [Lachnospiraceae bacterium]
MYTKTIYVIIDVLAIIDIFLTLNAIRQIRETYGRSLKNAMILAIIAILANIMIALSFNEISAEIAYSIYFISIDWVIYFLCGFCLNYTDHHDVVKKIALPAGLLMLADTISICANPVFRHQFYIYTNIRPGNIVFYQTGFNSAYYLHLALDYTAILLVLVLIIVRIFRSYSIYRVKYVIILSILLFIIALNIAYMTMSLVLDASVVFYAVAGTLIYFSICIFVPRRLMNVAIRRAADDMNEGLILFDISNNCIYLNTFAREHFELDEETCDYSVEPIATVIDTLAKNGQTFGEAVYIKEGDADNAVSRRYYKIRYDELADRKGARIGSYFLVEDSTEEVHYLNEINEAKNEADNANKAKSSFLASMSHEIRTPLNSVLGMNEMILRNTDDPQLLEYAESIRQSGDTLLSLINDILDFSKIEANKMDIVSSEYDPHKLLRDCYHFFYQTAQEHELYLRVKCDENMPKRLIGDENHIRQILSNMISNAVKYTKEGGVEIEMGADSADGTATLSLTVRDTGIGIAKEDVEHLFDAFRRVNEQMTANIQGTGLGLAITKELVTLMQGTIRVESEPGQGSRFCVELPQGIADPAPIGPFHVQLPSPTGHRYKESFRAENARILVVDDVPMNLKLITALLKKTKINIDTADGGQKAIELCMHTHYDVILLDHRMPDPDGVAVFKTISKEGMNQETPVIMLTANALTGAKEEYMDLGFAGYLSKPVHGADLEAMLLKHLPGDKVVTSAQE